MPAFVQTIADFNLIPRRVTLPTAWAILAAELAITMLMLFDRVWVFAGFALAVVVLAGFSMALASVLSRKIQTTCNCFGPSAKTVSPYDVWRNACFIACAVGGCGTQLALQQQALRIELWELGLLGCLAAAFVGITTQFQDIAQLLRQS